jgi:hypothetical protein
MGVLSWLFDRDRAREKGGERRIRVAVDRILQMSPRLRLVTGYEARLESAAAVALDYVEGLIEAVPPAREASAAAWSLDPYIHAFFSTPDDVANVLSHSAELRQYFDEAPDAADAFAVLGMAMTERRVLRAKQEGQITRTDVARTTVSFGDHKMRVCARTENELREVLVQRVLEQLVLEGLAQVVADVSRRESLEQERALLHARTQLLERKGMGTSHVFGSGDAPVSVAELARLAAQVEENERALESLGQKTESLERELGLICEVVSHPATHVHVTRRALRLDAANFVIEDESEQGIEIELNIAQIPANPGGLRTFMFIRFARRDLLPPVNMLDEARRLLI